MVMSADDFIGDLAHENDGFFADVPEEATTYWPVELSGKAAAEALKPRWFNELRGVEVIGRFIEKVPDLSLKVLVGRQVGDEAKHARVCRRRIEELGSSVLDFNPGPAQIAFGNLLDDFAYPEEFFAAQQFTVETESLKRNDKALHRFDPETAEMFRKHINPDERFHARLGTLGLQVFARTSAAQERARSAARQVREVHMAMVIESTQRLARLGFLS